MLVVINVMISRSGFVCDCGMGFVFMGVMGKFFGGVIGR